MSWECSKAFVKIFGAGNLVDSSAAVEGTDHNAYYGSSAIAVEDRDTCSK